jgi:hypothetical protein
MKKDIIIERNEIGNCPVCNNLLPLEIKKVNYKEKEIKICKHHFIQGEIKNE